MPLSKNNLLNQYRQLPQGRRPMGALDTGNYKQFKQNRGEYKKFEVKLCTECHRVYEVVRFASNNHIWHRLLYYGDFPTISLTREDCPECTGVDFTYKLGETISKK